MTHNTSPVEYGMTALPHWDFPDLPERESTSDAALIRAALARLAIDGVISQIGNQTARSVALRSCDTHVTIAYHNLPTDPNPPLLAITWLNEIGLSGRIFYSEASFDHHGGISERPLDAQQQRYWRESGGIDRLPNGTRALVDETISELAEVVVSGQRDEEMCRAAVQALEQRMRLANPLQ